jgi:hypothetical protein
MRSPNPVDVYRIGNCFCGQTKATPEPTRQIPAILGAPLFGWGGHEVKNIGNPPTPIGIDILGIGIPFAHNIAVFRVQQGDVETIVAVNFIHPAQSVDFVGECVADWQVIIGS